jgi:hypothetical protein
MVVSSRTKSKIRNKHEDGGDMFLRNMVDFSPDYTAVRTSNRTYRFGFEIG